MQHVIPEIVGTRPYQQIPFQYSLHYIEKEGGKVKHKEFLAESGTDPRRAIAESLCRDIPEDVCVLAYNKGFECGRINELANTFPDLRNHLMNIHFNMKTEEITLGGNVKGSVTDTKESSSTENETSEVKLEENENNTGEVETAEQNDKIEKSENEEKALENNNLQSFSGKLFEKNSPAQKKE